MKGLEGLVDGDHFWDAIADDAVFEFLYRFPGWPGKLESRRKHMKVMESYGMRLKRADGLVVHRSKDQRTVILEYEVHGVSPTGKAYNNFRCMSSGSLSRSTQPPALSENSDRAYAHFLPVAADTLSHSLSLAGLSSIHPRTLGNAAQVAFWIAVAALVQWVPFIANQILTTR
jgi:hypothetical protein